ncbi:MAG: hypothetical protein KC502_05650 [Myxococcales bacterium]|nr:hypothetical protein [Myxococcales bacterium]
MAEPRTISQRGFAVLMTALLLLGGAGCGEDGDTTSKASDALSVPTDADPDAVVEADVTADVAMSLDAVQQPDTQAGADGQSVAEKDATDQADGDASPTDAAVADAMPTDTPVAADPCDGQTCSGHGSCFALYDIALCSCDAGYYPVGTTDCWPETKKSPCFPNPCAAPDKGVCTVVQGKASCGCNVGFGLSDGLCVFATCPKVSAVTGITLYDQTGGSIAGGFDPLKTGDIVKIRIDIRVSAGTANATLELHPDNTELLTDRLAFDGKKVTTFKKKGALLEIPIALSPGDHSVELQGKLLTAYAPMSLNARITAPGACEIPESRSGARIGPLGLLDAKGFGCVNLDRNRSVQVTAEVVEKSTSVYGTANGTNTNYSPNGKIVATVTQCFIRNSDQVLFLAGDSLGEQPWGVDNYFVVEAFDHAPKKDEKPLKALVLQASSSVSATGGIQKIAGPHGDIRGTHIGVPNGSPFGWSAGHVRVTDLVPKGKNIWLRFYALDHGVVGRLTRVYIHSRRPELAPAECVNNAGCDHLGKGCVNGKCVGSACSGSCGGQAGIFCVGGYCTTQCNKGGGSCATGDTCAVRKCVPSTTKGICEASKYDADCPKGQTCHYGFCEKGCHHPRKQDQSYKYNNDFCKNGSLCPHCPKTEHGCWNNVCAQCEIDPHCSGGKVCVDRVCKTWP